MKFKIIFLILIPLIVSVIIYGNATEPNNKLKLIAETIYYSGVVYIFLVFVRQAYNFLGYGVNFTSISFLKTKLNSMMLGILCIFLLISVFPDPIAQNLVSDDQTNFDTHVEFLTNASHGVLGALLLVIFFYVGKYSDHLKGLNYKFSIVEEYFNKSKSKHRPMTDKERHNVSCIYDHIFETFTHKMKIYEKMPKMAIGIVLLFSVSIGWNSWSLYSDGIPNSIEYVKSIASLLLITSFFAMVWLHFQNALDKYREYEFYMDKQIAKVKALVPEEFFSKREIDNVENA